jgi:hypothetical protein
MSCDVSLSKGVTHHNPKICTARGCASAPKFLKNYKILCVILGCISLSLAIMLLCTIFYRHLGILFAVLVMGYTPFAQVM